MRDDLKEQVEALIMPVLNELSAELVDLQIRHKNKTVVVDIVADRPGGITIGECSFINKKVDQAIEKKQWFGEDYIVEVASPGLDRPLVTIRDFERVQGRIVRFHLLEKVGGKLEHSGKVENIENEQVLIKMKDDSIIAVPLKIISKAVQVIE